ncbi:MAG TPA: hypothetical protein VJV79_36450 [Polyangiaceae bacterium]|nr:hypothetical protein [Polyangiaceae bacterium]
MSWVRRGARIVGQYLLAFCALELVSSLVSSERVDAGRVPRLARAQLAHLGDGLEQRADEMQRLFPEGRVFMLALYGAAWVNVGRRAWDAAEHARAQGECQRSLALLEAPASRRMFGPAGGLPNGMFYEAWTHWIRGGCVLLTPEPDRSGALFGELLRSCERLAVAFREQGPFVDSYPGQAWPADSVVGVAGLSLCAKWLGDGYRSSASDWVTAARPLLDRHTGLLPHAAGLPGARGSSSALMSAFLPDVDPAFAREQYGLFRQHFSRRLLSVLPSVSEYPAGIDGSSDVDSGPLVFGVSGPATVVGIAAARENGDEAEALALRGAAEAIGFPSENGGRRRYGFGLLPVGEAFLAFASVAEPWTLAPRPWLGASSTDWRWRWRALCLSLLGLLGGLAAWLRAGAVRRIETVEQ